MEKYKAELRVRRVLSSHQCGLNTRRTQQKSFFLFWCIWASSPGEGEHPLLQQLEPHIYCDAHQMNGIFVCNLI